MKLQDRFTQAPSNASQMVSRRDGVRISPPLQVSDELRTLYERLPEPHRGRVFPQGLPRNRSERRGVMHRLRQALPALNKAAAEQQARRIQAAGKKQADVLADALEKATAEGGNMNDWPAEAVRFAEQAPSRDAE